MKYELSDFEPIVSIVDQMANNEIQSRVFYLTESRQRVRVCLCK